MFPIGLLLRNHALFTVKHMTKRPGNALHNKNHRWREKKKEPSNTRRGVGKLTWKYRASGTCSAMCIGLDAAVYRQGERALHDVSSHFLARIDYWASMPFGGMNCCHTKISFMKNDFQATLCTPTTMRRQSPKKTVLRTEMR